LARAARPAREALLEAGAELFARRGFEGAKSDAIARLAGVNKALINYHFGGKQGLYTAIVAATMGPALERLRALRELPMPPDERLRTLIAVFAETVRANPSFPSMLLHELLSGGAALGDEAFAYLADFFRTVAQLLEEGAAEGAFRRVEPSLAHLSLVSALAVFFATEPFRRRLDAQGKLPFPLPSSDAFVRHTQELMSRGLAADRPARPARRVRK
jgi:TetR/AcrR family transcriptional regulator